MRLGEELQLSLDDLELERIPARLYLRYQMTKTKRKRFTFISSETKRLLDEWLEYRLDYLRQASARGGIEFDPSDRRVFPFGRETYLFLWRQALQRAKMLKLDPVTRRMTLRPHNLRKYFRTRGEWTNPDIPEALMGHTTGLTAIYARFDQAEAILEKGYLEAEPRLSIYENSRTVTELKTQVSKQSDDIQQLVVNISVRNARLENDIAEIKNLHEQHVSELNKMQDWLVHEIHDQFETIVDGYKIQLNPHALDADIEEHSDNSLPIPFGDPRESKPFSVKIEN